MVRKDFFNLEGYHVLESGVITKVVLEPCLMLVLSENCFLRPAIFSERSMEPAISASMVKVFPNPIS